MKRAILVAAVVLLVGVHSAEAQWPTRQRRTYFSQTWYQGFQPQFNTNPWMQYNGDPLQYPGATPYPSDAQPVDGAQAAAGPQDFGGGYAPLGARGYGTVRGDQGAPYSSGYWNYYVPPGYAYPQDRGNWNYYPWRQR